MTNQTTATPVEFLKNLPTPAVDFEALVTTQKRNFDAAIEAHRVAAEGFKAIAKRQEEVIKETISQLQSQAGKLEAPEKLLETTTAIARRSFDQVRELAEMTARTNKEVLDLVVKRSNDALAELKAAVKLPQV
jgi:phasin family protein